MNQLESFKTISTLIFDVDGVMTNSESLVMDDGKLLRKVNMKDGYALKRATEHLKIAVITGGNSTGIIRRLQSLGIADIFTGAHDKLNVFENYVRSNQIDPGRILYMGDDLPDYPVMRKVGLPTCPSDAVKEIIKVAQYISPYKGGQGCVRDVIEKVLLLQNKWTI